MPKAKKQLKSQKQISWAETNVYNMSELWLSKTDHILTVMDNVSMMLLKLLSLPYSCYC